MVLCAFFKLNAQIIKYVNPSATGNGSGNSWANAYTSFQAAINAAPTNLSTSQDYQIWVKAGVYTPGLNKTDHFLIDKGQLKIYGGFSGTETAINQRNPVLNPTILSGDLLRNDSGIPTLTTPRTDNAYNVLTINASNLVIDGFTISGGHADGDSQAKTDRGAGIRFDSGVLGINVTVKNCIFENNVAKLAAAVLLDTNVNHNSLTYLDYSFERCIFRNNTAYGGAGFFIRQLNRNPPRVAIVNSLFESNRTLANGSYPGGAAIWATNLYASNSTLYTNVYVRNSTFVKNFDERTNGNVIVAGTSASGAITRVRMDNSIFHQNTSLSNTTTARAFSKATYAYEGTGVVAHSQDDDNFSQVLPANITNAISLNPLFTDFTNGDYTLQNNSPCKDNGLNGLDYGTIDLAGNPRVFNTTVDMGAYEKQSTSTCNNIVHIPDANFKAALLAHGSTITGSGISTIDTDGDGNICTTEAAAYTGTLRLYNKSISDLTGIEAFVNTTVLECHNNQLTSINLTQNTSLTKLGVSHNQLTSLDVSQNTALTWLVAQYMNQLTSLNVRNGANTILTNFYADKNPYLTCIEVDDVAYSTSNWTIIDSQTSFSTNCPSVWTGATDSDWANTNNWAYGVPTSTDNATIDISNSTYPLLDNLAVEVNDLTINSGANLTINTNAALKVNGDFDNQGSLKMYANDQESASLKVDGTTSGQVEFNRQASDQWYLLSTPFFNESTANFVTNNNIETKGSGSNLTYAIGKYEAANSGYTYYQSTNTSWTSLNGLTGYAIKRNSPGNLRFLGVLRTTSGGSAINTPNVSNKWILLSNGYTAHMALNNNANGSNFLQYNMQYNTLNNTNTAVYLWDRTTQSFQPYNQSSSAKYLQPGESFFVEAATNANYVYIYGSHLVHNVGASALRNVPQTKINILVNSGKQIRKTQIKYLNNTTKGLDVGYDAGVFTGEAQNFNVFTQLADGSYNTTNFALQCVAKSELKTTIIPLGIKAEAGKEITFSTETAQFPTDANVYLEDAKTGSFTNLAKQTYTFTTTEAMNGIGRFYIHTQAKALSIDDNTTDSIAIVKNGNQLTINNLTETGTLSIYSVLGKEVVTEQVNTANNTIKLPKVATGMYVVTVKTANKTATKKIIIN